MSDIALSTTDFENGTVVDFDLQGGDLALDEGLRTAVLISVFSDARADSDDLSGTDVDRRGWWGDMLSNIQQDSTGSKLWLLMREKQTDETLVRAEEYVSQSLAWMIEDGVADNINVAANWNAPGFIVIKIAISRPNGQELNYNFDYAWKAEGQR